MKNLSNGDVVIPVEGEKDSETDDEKRNGMVQGKGKVSILSNQLKCLCFEFHDHLDEIKNMLKIRILFT